MAANNYYHGFTHGGTLHSAANPPQPAYATAQAAAYGQVPPGATPYAPPPPPGTAGYDQTYQQPATIQYPGVTVSSDYGYGANPAAAAGFDASYYPAAFPAYQPGPPQPPQHLQHQQAPETPAFQTGMSQPHKAASASSISETATSSSSPATTSAGNPWNKTKNSAGVLGSRDRPGYKVRGGMTGSRPRGGFGHPSSSGPHHPPRSEQLHYCDVCKISCAGPQAYKEHLAGQKHKKKEAATKAGMAAALPKGGSALHCELCDITCTGSDAYAAHIRGSKHQKVVKLHQKLGKPIPSNEPTIISNKPEDGRSVSNGNDSAKELTPSGSSPSKSLIGPTKPATASRVETDTAPGSVKQVTESLTGEKVNIPKLPDELDVEPVGETYVEEIRDGDKLVTFNCKLCDCKFTDPNAKEMHLKGRRHRLQYKKKVDPSLEVVDKTFGRNKRMDDRRMGGPMMMDHRMGMPGGRRGPLLGPGPPEFGRNMRMMDEGDRRYWDEGWGMFGNGNGGPGPRFGLPGPGFGPMGPRPMGAPPSLMNMPPVPAPPFFGMGPPPPRMSMGPGPMHQPPMWMNETTNDKFIGAKHGMLYPDEDQFAAIQKMVANVEKALKMVSDVLAESKASGEGEKGKAEAPRILKGVMRVGALAKGLLLSGETDVELVVLCTEKPTRSLLQSVLVTLPKQLANVHGGSEVYNLEQRFDDAALKISTFGEPKYSVLVTFTSFLMRDENVDPKSATPAKADPEDLVNKDRCLEALAKLRHSKWYQAKANGLQSCTMLIRVLRDYCRREPAWSSLKPWALELLVQKVLESAGAPLNPGDALKRIFEAVSAGLLLPDGPGLLDPCEKNCVDAAGYLTPQQREDLTAAGQTALRLIAFRSLYKVLDMDSTVPPDRRWQGSVPPARKRRLDNSESPSSAGGKGVTEEASLPASPGAATDKKTKVEPNAEIVEPKVENPDA